MTDLQRFGTEPKIDVATSAKRPWNTPVVIKAEANATDKFILTTEFGIGPGASGPS